MKSNEEIIKAVVNFPGGCEDQKKAFLKTLNLEIPNKKKTLVLTVEIDLTNENCGVGGGQYPSEWTTTGWKEVFTAGRSSFPKWYQKFGPRGYDHLVVTKREIKNA